MYRLWGAGDHFYIYNEHSAGIEIYNNSVFTGQHTVTANGRTAAYYHHTTGNISDVTVYNNDFYINRRSRNVSMVRPTLPAAYSKQNIWSFRLKKASRYLIRDARQNILDS